MKRYNPEVVWIDPYTAVPRMDESDTGLFCSLKDVGSIEERLKLSEERNHVLIQMAEEQRVFLMYQIDKLRTQLNAAKDAISPVVEYYKWLIDNEDGIEGEELVIGSSFCGVTKEQLNNIVAVYED